MSGRHHRGGMTLLETLASLALIGLLASAAFGWVTASQRSLAEVSTSATWHRAACATLTILHDDLACGDAEGWAAEAIVLRQSVHAGAPAIKSVAFPSRTSGAGPTLVEYEFEREDSLLRRSLGSETRLLLGGVASFAVEILREDPGDSGSDPVALLAKITGPDGRLALRRCRLGAREAAP